MYMYLYIIIKSTIEKKKERKKKEKKIPNLKTSTFKYDYIIQSHIL